MFKVVKLPSIQVPVTESIYYVNYTPTEEELMQICSEGVVIKADEFEDSATTLEDFFSMMGLTAESDEDEEYDEDDVDHYEDEDELETFIEPYLNLPGFKDATTHLTTSLMYKHTEPQYILIYKPNEITESYMFLALCDTETMANKIKDFYEKSPITNFRFSLMYNTLKENTPEYLFTEADITTTLVNNIQSHYTNN